MKLWSNRTDAAHAGAGIIVKSTPYDVLEAIEDLEVRAGRAVRRAEAALKLHQRTTDLVATREFGQQYAFAVEEALAVISSQVGLPAAVPAAVIAALRKFDNQMHDIDERLEWIINTIDEEIKSMKNQS